MLDLGFEVAQIGDGGRRDVGDLVRERDQRQVLALAELGARRRADIRAANRPVVALGSCDSNDSARRGPRGR